MICLRSKKVRFFQMEKYEYNCECCHYMTNNKYSYNKHLQTKRHIRGGCRVQYTCDSCNYTTKNKSNYEKHLESKKHLKSNSNETKMIKIECPVCYESKNNDEYYNPPCKHKICTHCFLNIKIENDYKCVLCRKIHKYKLCDVNTSLDYKFKSGKYKGKTIEYVYLNDWKYVRELYFKSKNIEHEHIKNVIDNY